MSEIIGGINESKVRHGDLILEGVCAGCAHCGMRLTDSVSIERGLGPICSKKGYMEEPSFNDGQDVMDAMIDVAKWPDLMRFLTDRAGGEDPRRGLMNGMVRICSLNRQNKPLVKACCNAIESLGWKRLANALRESCMIVRISKCKTNEDFVELRVVYAHRKWDFVCEVRAIPGTSFERSPTQHNLVPRKQLPTLWEALVRHYPNECGKGENGGFKIPEKLED